MTIIIILEDDDGFVIGADTGELFYNRLIRKIDSKVIFQNITVCTEDNQNIGDNILWVGLTGHGRIAEFINHKFNPPKHQYDIDEWDYLYDYCKELKLQLDNYNLVIEKDNMSSTQSFLLILYQGKVFYIDDNFGITHNIEEYYCIGCAEELALGSLYTTKDGSFNSEIRVKKALECCNYHDCYINDNFTIFKVGKNGKIIKSIENQKV